MMKQNILTGLVSLCQKKIKKFIGNRNIKANIFRMQTFGSITFG